MSRLVFTCLLPKRDPSMAIWLHLCRINLKEVEIVAVQDCLRVAEKDFNGRFIEILLKADFAAI
jgi:hypothetical protein